VIKLAKYDDKEITCSYCKFKGKPIIEKNKLEQGPYFGMVGPPSSAKYRKFILICPNCKALIGTK